VRPRHLDAIRDAVGAAGADALWVHPAIDFRYLTGLAPLALERPTALVIPAHGGRRVLAPQMLAEELAPLGDVVAWSDGDGPEGAIAHALFGLKRVLVEPDLPMGVAVALAGAGVQLDLDPGILSRLRERKTVGELEALRAAGREADDAMAWVAGLDVQGRTERGLALELEARFLTRGVRPFDDYVVAAGANAALPHHASGDTPVARPFLTDFGCVVDGYHSDTTRVHGAEGEAAEAYAIVKAAHDAVIAGLEPGMPAEDADRLARDVIEEAGYGERFIHRLGHGVGLEIHEEPYLRPGNPKPLEVGHVFSVEPGIYVPGAFGVRYENLVHLGPEGPELLNAAPA
jgi:Xaa-Pro aminopeptidase